MRSAPRGENPVRAGDWYRLLSARAAVSSRCDLALDQCAFKGIHLKAQKLIAPQEQSIVVRGKAASTPVDQRTR